MAAAGRTTGRVGSQRVGSQAPPLLKVGGRRGAHGRAQVTRTNRRRKVAQRRATQWTARLACRPRWRWRRVGSRVRTLSWRAARRWKRTSGRRSTRSRPTSGAPAATTMRPPLEVRSQWRMAPAAESLKPAGWNTRRVLQRSRAWRPRCPQPRCKQRKREQTRSCSSWCSPRGNCCRFNDGRSSRFEHRGLKMSLRHCVPDWRVGCREQGGWGAVRNMVRSRG
mmetsp:Transcript_88793/g.267137  ORF Transcript_88793/g.267137 Transcript_88793/m.267137 type:complete len:223 (-) Transcript_88793:128-796(-)